MDNYKIKVKDEAESKEAQELFVQLGYELFKSSRLGMVATENNGTVYPDVIENWDAYEGKEITFPQLNDLVVLSRKNPADGNYRLFISDSQGELNLYKTIDDVFYVFSKELKGWDKSRAVNIKTANLIKKGNEKDPALISGADVPALIKKGESVQFRSAFNVQGGGEWKDLDLEHDEEEFSLGDLINTRFEWRLKPQTIKVELEIPAPYKAKIGGRDDASFVLNVGRHQYCYKNEEDYLKARDALEAVFDSAVRGTNS